MAVRRFLLLPVILLAVVSTLTGCQSTAPSRQADAEPEAAGQMVSEPPPAANPQPAGGMLLKTGAIQLGPGVGRNTWRWQGDGEGGF